MSTVRQAKADLPSRRPGRPRSARADHAILDAALELLLQQGFEGMSIEEVAELAGVGKATIYRRWPSKDDLVIAAVCCMDEDIEIPDTGSLHGDLSAMLDAKRVKADMMWPAMARIIGEAVSNPHFMEVYWNTVIKPRRAVGARVIERAKARGEIRADVDSELIIDMLAGFIIYRMMVVRDHFERPSELADQIVDTLFRGIVATTVSSN